MNNVDINRFIELQYPAVKTEVSNADSKIVGILTASSIFLATCLIALNILMSFNNTIVGLSIFIPFIILQMISIIISTYALYSNRTIHHRKNIKRTKELVVTKFFTYKYVLKDEFLDNFKQKKNSLNE